MSKICKWAHWFTADPLSSWERVFKTWNRSEIGMLMVFGLLCQILYMTPYYFAVVRRFPVSWQFHPDFNVLNRTIRLGVIGKIRGWAHWPTVPKDRVCTIIPGRPCSHHHGEEKDWCPQRMCVTEGARSVRLLRVSGKLHGNNKKEWQIILPFLE